MRMIICGCEKSHMEYMLDTLGLIAKRDKKHITVTAPVEHERNDDMCRYVTMDEDIHTDIGKGMADALIAYRNSACVHYIDNLKNSGMLILVKDCDSSDGTEQGHRLRYIEESPSVKKEAAYLRDILYLKSDAVIIEKTKDVEGLFRFYAEEEILRLLGIR